MQQGLELGRRIEIAAFRPKHKVRNKASTSRNMLSQLHKLIGQQCKPTKGIACR